jgi:predicted SAM-dependent methyltransferase
MKGDAMLDVIRQWAQPLYRTARRGYQALRARRVTAQRHLTLLRTLKQHRDRSDALKVILGGGGTTHDGWVPTEVDVLDITNAGNWGRYFRPSSIDRLLAEHVLEHLTEAQNRAGLELCFRYLKPGGFFRVAVPDGHRRDHAYVEEVAPPKDGHQLLFTLESLTTMLQEAGFQVRPLEYFDSDERFHAVAWDSADGHVRRSVRFDRQVAFRRGDLYYTSLIVDAVKPL